MIVAAGFDAAAGDQLGGCFVTPPCYAHMTHMLMSLADGKVVVCLEVCATVKLFLSPNTDRGEGRLQPEVYLQVRSCGYTDFDGRTARSH